MKIAYLTCVYPPYPGGIGVAAEGMAHEMARRGHDVTVVSPHSVKPWLRFGNAAFLPQVLWRLREVDIIHVLYPFYGTAELVPLIKRRVRAKIVVHHMMDAVGSGWLGMIFRIHARLLTPKIFRAADRVLVLSEDYWHNSGIEKLNLHNVDVVPNGVDVQLFTPQLSAAQSENQVPVILFVGGLDRAHYFKGVEVLIEACAILKGRGRRFHCRIVGDGDMRSVYEKRAHDLGLLKTQVEFSGLIPHNGLPHYYQEAAVCVVPATERVECFSITAAEAQACGIPVIVTDFPGVRVTIEDGVTGYVAQSRDPKDLADKILLILSDFERAKEMGRKGAERVEKMYSWKVIGDKLEHVYESMCNK